MRLSLHLATIALFAALVYGANRIDLDAVIASAFDMVDIEGECAQQACEQYHAPNACTPSLILTFRPRCAMVLQHAGLDKASLDDNVAEAKVKVKVKAKAKGKSGKANGDDKGKAKERREEEEEGEGLNFTPDEEFKRRFREKMAGARGSGGGGEGMGREELVGVAGRLEELLAGIEKGMKGKEKEKEKEKEEL